MHEEPGSNQNTELGLYTICCFLSCCCLGNIVGFVLCFICRNRIKHHSKVDDSVAVSKWAKRFWICFFVTAFLNVIVAVLTALTTGTVNILGYTTSLFE